MTRCPRLEEIEIRTREYLEQIAQYQEALDRIRKLLERLYHDSIKGGGDA